MQFNFKIFFKLIEMKRFLESSGFFFGTPSRRLFFVDGENEAMTGSTTIIDGDDVGGAVGGKDVCGGDAGSIR